MSSPFNQTLRSAAMISSRFKFGAAPQIEKIRSCFFKADESKLKNCVPESATTQHIEAPINANNIHPNKQSRFCCQD
jgi:hypothetical protein